MATKSRPGARIAAIRAAGQRFSLAAFILLSIGLLVFGRLDPEAVDALRTKTMDVAAPVLEAFSRPTQAVSNWTATVAELSNLRSENARLMAENVSLRQFQEAAYHLEAENLSLQLLLNYRPPQSHGQVTARVISDNSGAFVRSLAISVGSDNGVRDGMAILGTSSLVGRTVQVGEKASRVLLITDLNARIPVMVEGSRHRGIMAGDNTARPRLMHLPPGAETVVGSRVVTSGHGGLFPPGLPVGVVVQDGPNGQARVQPLEDLSTVEYVRVVDFSPWVSEVEMLQDFQAGRIGLGDSTVVGTSPAPGSLGVANQ